MDDVGQTLLNWASAFGTQEMVEFLCQKGADVNKGQVEQIILLSFFPWMEPKISKLIVDHVRHIVWDFLQRSSSLHYAACFGRPQIAKVLVSHYICQYIVDK